MVNKSDKIAPKIPDEIVEKINSLLSGPKPAKKNPRLEACKTTIITAYQNKWTAKEIAEAMIEAGAKNINGPVITKALLDWEIIVKTPEQIAKAAESAKKAKEKAALKAKEIAAQKASESSN